MKETAAVGRKAILFMAALLVVTSAGTRRGESQGSGYLFVPTGSNFFVYHRGGGADFIIRTSKLTDWKIDREFAAIAGGKRVMTAKDDPAVMAVSERMESLMQGLMQESRNAEDMRNYLAYVDSTLGQNSELLGRIRLLIQRSYGVFMGPDEREIGQVEIDQLLRQIDMNAEFSEYNRQKIIPFLTVKDLGLEGLSVVRSPEGAITKVDRAMEKIRFLRSKAGIRSNVLTFEIEGKTRYAMEMANTGAAMTGADIGEEVGGLIRNSVILKIQHGLLLRAK